MMPFGSPICRAAFMGLILAFCLFRGANIVHAFVDTEEAFDVVNGCKPNCVSDFKKNYQLALKGDEDAQFILYMLVGFGEGIFATELTKQDRFRLANYWRWEAARNGQVAAMDGMWRSYNKGIDAPEVFSIKPDVAQCWQDAKNGETDPEVCAFMDPDLLSYMLEFLKGESFVLISSE